MGFLFIVQEYYIVIHNKLPTFIKYLYSIEPCNNMLLSVIELIVSNKVTCQKPVELKVAAGKCISVELDSYDFVYIFFYCFRH